MSGSKRPEPEVCRRLAAISRNIANSRPILTMQRKEGGINCYRNVTNRASLWKTRHFRLVPTSSAGDDMQQNRETRAPCTITSERLVIADARLAVYHSVRLEAMSTACARNSAAKVRAKSYPAGRRGQACALAQRAAVEASSAVDKSADVLHCGIGNNARGTRCMCDTSRDGSGYFGRIFFPGGSHRDR